MKNISTVLLIRALDFTYRHPIDYHRHNANKRSRRTIITAYIKKVIFAAFIFCIPKFFESKIVAKTEQIEVADHINDGNKMVMKQTGTCVNLVKIFLIISICTKSYFLCFESFIAPWKFGCSNEIIYLPFRWTFPAMTSTCQT